MENREPLKSYRDLAAWQTAMDLVEELYALSKRFPDEEKYGLTSQLRRAAMSIPSNIAEGYGRSHRKEYVHHLFIARGSLMEIETQVILAVRLGFVDREEAEPVWNNINEVGRIPGALIRSLEKQFSET